MFFILKRLFSCKEKITYCGSVSFKCSDVCMWG